MPKAMERWKRVLRLQGSSSGSYVQVDEAAATASWMDGGKKMVRLLDGQAARYLEIQGLKNLACQAFADVIEGKTPEEIRATFNIKKDMSPEEEEAAGREGAARVAASHILRREWMDIVNSKFCTFYELDF